MRPLATALALLALAQPAGAAEPDVHAARKFVTDLYAAYQREPGPDYLGKQAKQVFTPDLVKLMRRSAASVPKDEAPPLDGDPICDCQDYEIKAVAVNIAPQGAGKAQATARFQNAGEPKTIRLDLVTVKGAWRVADVHTKDTPSLVAFLQASLKP